MSDPPPRTPQAEPEVLYCHGHPDVATRLRCSRCGRPICGRCAIPATVGQHCPWCVAEARRSQPRVRSSLAATAPGVLGIIAVNFAVWVAQILLPGLTESFALIPPQVADGEWWRLITPVFLHATQGPFFLLHILFNSYVLYVYGPEVERAHGTPWFLSLYLTCGFAASAASFAFGPWFKAGIGASGAVFGIVGVLIAHLARRRSRSAIAAGYLRGLLAFVGINLLFGFVAPGVDNYAHLGGLVAGLGLGFAFELAGRRPAEAAVARAGTLAAVAGVAALLVVARVSLPGGLA